MPDLARILLDPPDDAIAALDAARAPDSPLRWIAALHEAAERLRAPAPDLAAGIVEDHWDADWAEAALFAEPARALAAQSADRPQPRSYSAGGWRLVVTPQPSGDLQLTLHGRAPVSLSTATGTPRLRPGRPAALPASELLLPPRIRLPDGQQLTLD